MEFSNLIIVYMCVQEPLVQQIIERWPFLHSVKVGIITIMHSRGIIRPANWAYTVKILLRFSLILWRKLVGPMI